MELTPEEAKNLWVLLTRKDERASLTIYANEANTVAMLQAKLAGMLAPPVERPVPLPPPPPPNVPMV